MRSITANTKLHAMRVQAALEAINAVHSDKSVPLETTLESMEELEDECSSIIDALKFDMLREE